MFIQEQRTTDNGVPWGVYIDVWTSNTITATRTKMRNYKAGHSFREANPRQPCGVVVHCLDAEIQTKLTGQAESIRLSPSRIEDGSGDIRNLGGRGSYSNWRCIHPIILLLWIYYHYYQSYH